MSDRRCTVVGCERPHLARGFCGSHYSAARRSGALTKAPQPTTEQRFWSKVDKSGDCWIWTASTMDTGYGSFYPAEGGKRTVQAHRWAYVAQVGPIAEDLQIDHLCRNRACVNPAHMQPVTQRENILRGDSPAARHARKTHCDSGHEFTASNTYSPPSRPNYRMCRECCRIRDRRRRRGAHDGVEAVS